VQKVVLKIKSVTEKQALSYNKILLKYVSFTGIQGSKGAPGDYGYVE
jgi:hypothetical protein